MRPVLLDVAGFAAFREPTTVDFRGADYFAFVGPTGSGKSTVIDAMVFALYGSVPRWDDRRSVRNALAPTMGRGTVKLVFDVGGARYVAARELRRGATGAVTVRGARLERLRDPAGVAGPDDPTEPLADGANAVTEAVERLLGLPFADFTSCVVLPQGAFAEFLHTEPRRRQEKLVRLLGLGVYDEIAREANSEAAAARQRAEVLAGELAGYADATVEALAATTARVDALAGLTDRTSAALPGLAAAVAAQATAVAEVARLRTETEHLTAVVVPSGLDDLQQRRERTTAARTTATAALGAAETADTDAREALAAGPARGPLEQLRRDHAELSEVTAAGPAATERLATAAAAEAAATDAATAARATAETTRTERDAAVAAAATAATAVGRADAERAALAAVAVPAGIDDLHRRRRAAATALAARSTELAAAETADSAARAALAAAPDRAALEHGRRDLQALHTAQAELTAAADGWPATLRAGEQATATLDAARERMRTAEQRRVDALHADLAAGLRPALVPGEPCPVCTQPVSTLPAPHPSGAAEIDAATAEVTAAAAALDRARSAAATAVARRERAEVDVARGRAAVAQLRAGITDRLPALLVALGAPPSGSAPSGSALSGSALSGSAPSGETASGESVVEPELPRLAQLDAALAHGEQLAADATRCAGVVRAARRARDAAASTVDDGRAAAATAAAVLRATREPLVPFGAPVLERRDTAGAGAVDGTDLDDPDDLRGGWAALVDWAGGLVADRTAALPQLRADAHRAAQAQHAAEQAHADAGQHAERCRRAETVAARAAQEARSAADALQARAERLRTAVAGQPTAAEAAAALTRLDALDVAVRAADDRLRSARATHRAAVAAADAVERDVAGAWDGLRTARDPLVPLGAPPTAGTDLPAAWAALTAWAGAAADERAIRSGVATAEAATAQTDSDRIRAALLDDLAALGVDLVARRGEGGAPPRADPAVLDDLTVLVPAAVATAAASARAAHERVVERSATADRLAAERDRATEAGQVAALLGKLLRSDGFPRWLVASALDTLVADASQSLAELSGGQYTLTHAGGEFLVVDHTDADAHRPVKTLSGGETFQASLALALALSRQLTGLAADGAARLESIFLDEGFGTLDEANLDVVASTLEALAAAGDRMVGVVTHVPALAERVPVRFVVRRDQRSSSVTREEM